MMKCKCTICDKDIDRNDKTISIVESKGASLWNAAHPTDPYGSTRVLRNKAVLVFHLECFRITAGEEYAKNFHQNPEKKECKKKYCCNTVLDKSEKYCPKHKCMKPGCHNQGGRNGSCWRHP